MDSIIDIIFGLKKKDIHLEIKGEKLLVLSDNDLNNEDVFVIQNNKKEIIDFLRNQTSRKSGLIPFVSESDDYAISSAQRRLWVLSRFDGVNEAYNITKEVR